MARRLLEGVGDWTALAGEASFRTFYRRRVAGREAAGVIAMDAPPDREDNARFVALARRFRSAGIGVPEVLAFDSSRGFLLVEDLGTDLYEEAYRTPDHEAVLTAALDTLIRFQKLPEDPGVPLYTRSRLHDELELFRTWFIEGWLGLSLDAAAASLLEEAYVQLIDIAEAQPKVCIHRDFHCRNLIWRADRTTGVVDFQDALWGPVAYDLASLLRDCYVRFEESEIDRWRDRYLTLASASNIVSIAPDVFSQWVDLTALQRQLKAIGIFARLELRDGRDSHLKDIPPVLDHAISVGRRHGLGDLAEWLDTEIRPRATARA